VVLLKIINQRPCVFSKGKLYVKDVDDLDGNEGQKDFVVGYGAISKVKKLEAIAKQGIVGVTREDIVRDVIFDSGGYQESDILHDAFPNLIKGQVNIPIYKYLNGAGLITEDGSVTTEGLCDSIRSRIDYGVEKFIPSGYEAQRSKKISQVQEGIEELYKAVDFNLFLRMAVFVPPEKVELDDLESILKKHAYDDFSSGEKSQFIKAVCVYDLIKYSRRYSRA